MTLQCSTFETVLRSCGSFRSPATSKMLDVAGVLDPTVIKFLYAEVFLLVCSVFRIK